MAFNPDDIRFREQVRAALRRGQRQLGSYANILKEAGIESSHTESVRLSRFMKSLYYPNSKLEKLHELLKNKGFMVEEAPAPYGKTNADIYLSATFAECADHAAELADRLRNPRFSNDLKRKWILTTAMFLQESILE